MKDESVPRLGIWAHRRYNYPKRHSPKRNADERGTRAVTHMHLFLDIGEGIIE